MSITKSCQTLVWGVVLAALFLLAHGPASPIAGAVANPNALVGGGAVMTPAPPEDGEFFSQGDIGPMAVIGADERTRITPATSPPWRWIVYLEIDQDGGAYDPDVQCTGFFVGPRQVMTAGHCLYTPATANWHDFVRVVPGKDAASEPYGTTTVGITSLAVSSGWASGLGAAYDYGIIQLPDETMHNLVGSFGYAVLPDGDLLNAGINVAGYPTDKTPVQSLWFDANTITNVAPRIISHEADTFGGESGSPIWESDGTHQFVVGIHAYAAGSLSCNPGDNCGTRITSEVADALEAAGAYPRITNLASITCRTLTKAIDPPASGSFTHAPPNSGGCPTDDANPQYAPTTAVRLEASPAAGHVWSNWTGADVAGANPGAATMSANKTVTAHFALDGDGDGIADPSDNCPAWPNPAQAALPWNIPANDADCDGFSAAVEAHTGTDPNAHCNATPALNDEADVWPSDFNDSQSVNLSDLILMGPSYNKTLGSAGYNARFDLNASNNVNLSDVILLGPFYNRGCG